MGFSTRYILQQILSDNSWLVSHVYDFLVRVREDTTYKDVRNKKDISLKIHIIKLKEMALEMRFQLMAM